MVIVRVLHNSALSHMQFCSVQRRHMHLCMMDKTLAITTVIGEIFSGNLRGRGWGVKCFASHCRPCERYRSRESVMILSSMVLLCELKKVILKY